MCWITDIEWFKKTKPGREVPLWSNRLCNGIRLRRVAKKIFKAIYRRVVVPGDKNSFSWMKYAKRYQMQKRDSLRRFFHLSPECDTSETVLVRLCVSGVNERSQTLPTSSTWLFFDTFCLALHALSWRIFSHYTLIEFTFATSGEAFPIYLITMFAVELPEWFVKC